MFIFFETNEQFFKQLNAIIGYFAVIGKKKTII